MDKLKPIIAAVKKYHFWVICGAMLLTTLVCWWLATSGLAGQYKRQESKIDGDFSGVAGIQANHPNQDVIDEINKRHTALKKVVFDAWEILYSEQKEKNPFPTDVLGEDFEKQFKNLRPQEELARRYRERYQNYIKDHLPKLRQMIEVRRPVEEKPAKVAGGLRPGGGMMPGGEMGGMSGAAAEAEWTGVIDWNESDYAQLLARFEWQQTPSTQAIVLAQEDLWVYEALLRVIEKTNEGATNQNNASVKRIEALEIGRAAVTAWKNTENVLGLQDKQGGMGGGMAGPGAPGMGGPAPMGGEMGMGMGMGMSSGAATDGTSEEQIIRQLVESRYIDDKGQPLPSQEQYPYTKQPYAEFRMMPIRMSLVMDQRKLPKFLVECANSNMPIEVRRVRLLKTQGPASGSMAGGGGGYGMGGIGMEGAYRPPRGGPMGGGIAGSPPQETGQFDMPVEIHAVIYIYNPPDREKLGTGAASTAQPAGLPPTPAAGGISP